MTKLVAALPAMSTTQLLMMLDFYEGESIRVHYAGLRADIRAVLRARGVSDSERASVRGAAGGLKLVR
jgi:hypothetical protein